MSNGKHDPDCMEPVEDRVDILFRELELAVKWQRPSLLLAIYCTESAHLEAEAKLRNDLNHLGHQVHHLQTRTNNFGDYISQVATYSNAEKAVFFADGFNWMGLQDQNYDHNTFEQSRDFFIKNKIRIVFWLTEANANALAHYAPDFWTFRHCSVEFVDIVEVVEMAAESDTIQPAAGQIISESPAATSETNKDNPFENKVFVNDQAEESNINQLLTLGILNWRKGDHAKAIEVLDSALKLTDQVQGQDVKALCFNSLALVHTSTGKIDEAIQAYEQARTITPPSIFPWSNLGNLYSKVKRDQDALNCFQKAIEVDSRDAISWNGLGEVYLRTGQTEDAISAFQKAIEFSPEFACPWNGLGNAYLSGGNPEQAAAAYQRTIELDPENSTACCNLAVIYTRQGKYADAVPLYQKSIDLLNKDGTKTVLWDRLGNTLGRSNSTEPIPVNLPAAVETEPQEKTEEPASSVAEAVPSSTETAAQAATTSRSTPLVAASADSYESSPKLAEEELVFSDPAQAPSVQLASHTSGEIMGKNEKSNRSRFGWKFGNPFSSSAHSKRTSPQKPAQNLVILDKGHAISDQVPPTQAMADDDRGGSHLTQGHQQGGFSTTEDVRGSDNFLAELPVVGDDMPAYSSADVHTELDFINAQEWNEIGKVYFSLGDMEQAILTFNKAIEMNPKFGWPYSNMALAYTQQGRLEEAIFVYKKSIELFRDDKNKAIAWNRLGNVYLRLGNDDKAIAAYRMADQLDVENGVSEPNSGDLLPEFESYNTHVWNEVGRIFYNKNINDKAIEAYQKAINIDPTFGWSYSNLALAFSRQGRYAEAIPLYNKSIDLFRNDRDKAFSWNRLGDTYRRLNDHDNALAAYEMAVGLDPDNNSLLKRARFSLLSNCATR